MTVLASRAMPPENHGSGLFPSASPTLRRWFYRMNGRLPVDSLTWHATFLGQSAPASQAWLCRTWPSPLVIGGGMKVAYDLALYRAFRKLRPPEEWKATCQLIGMQTTLAATKPQAPSGATRCMET